MTPSYIIIHHSASPPNTTVAQIDKWHKDRGFPKSRKGFYVGYHWVIEEIQATKTREVDEVGAHALGGYNYNSIGICLTGNFMHDTPTKFQLSELRKLVLSYMKKFNIPDVRVLGHRDVWATSCPGDNLMPIVNNLARLPMVIENLVKDQKKKLKEIQDGKVAIAFCKGKGVAVVRDNQKTILPVDEVMMNVFSVGMNKADWDTIPTKPKD